MPAPRSGAGAVRRSVAGGGASATVPRFARLIASPPPPAPAQRTAGCVLQAPRLRRGAVDVDRRNRAAVSPAAGGAACGGRATRGFFDSGGGYAKTCARRACARVPPPRAAKKEEAKRPPLCVNLFKTRALLYSESGGDGSS
ncbi:MAG: hypothetical protein Pg6A_16830 [Termitinemataceae bacterium]|nr:MAG: hypothetical protein Pg6A_16830 [Termitinemataceae bacterium]